MSPLEEKAVKTNCPPEETDVFDLYLNPRRQQAAREGRPFEVDFEITTQCFGACKICHTHSFPDNYRSLPLEKILEVIDQLVELQISQVWWEGGDPLIHPGIFEAVRYAASKGLKNAIFTSGLPLTKRMCQRILDYFSRKEINLIGVHIDALDPEVYNRLHWDPKGLEKKVKGYKSLMEVGYPADRILPCLTMTAPALEVIEETLDWYIDEMGAKFVEMTVFKPHGLGAQNRELEPTLSGLRHAFEYRAKKLGNPAWLRMGTTECSSIRCQTNFYVAVDGTVKLCPCIPPELFPLGNVYQETLPEIFRQHGRQITMNDLKIQGQCSECENNADGVCRGCRAAAYHYTGDFQASDPKCWRNPAAKETYLR